MPMIPDISNISTSASMLVKELILVKCYENFMALLTDQAKHYESQGRTTIPLAVIPIRIFRSWVSTTKTYALVYQDRVFLDLKPSFVNQDVARVAVFNHVTIKRWATISPTFWDRFNIFNCGEHISLTFIRQDGTEMTLRLLAEVSGENTLTQDKEKTKYLSDHLKTMLDNMR